MWIAAVALAVCAGCAKTDEGKTIDASSAQIEQRQKEEVQRLNTAQNLPPQARAMSVQMMQHQQNNAQSAAATFPRK